MLLAVYSLALLVSAALLFVLEPLVGKLALPLLGSTPEVWNATVMFFQAALLAGYAYSHATSRRLRPRTQAAVQLGLLAVAAVALPIALPGGARPPASADPVPWLLWLLALTAGLPFLALAANAPMLQHWLAGRRLNPYVLYAASNAGSIVGLLAYPLLIERLLTLHEQGVAWSIGYAVVFGLVLACAVTLRGRPTTPEAAAPAESIERRQPVKWIALAFVPSSLMLGTTTYITRDLSPVPLLWVIPLAVYLLSFVIAFAPGFRPAAIVDITRKLLPIVLIVVVYTLALGSQRPLSLLLPLHVLGLGLAALMCHSRLAASTPPASDLTRFYLYVALGGVLGGVFNALIAPVVFPTLIEYPLALVAAALLRPPAPKTRPDLLEFLLRDPRPTRWMDFLAPALVGTAFAVAVQAAGGGAAARSAILGVACGLVVNFGRRPVRFGLAVAAILLAAALVGVAGGGGRVLARDRSFFGVYKVVSSGGYHQLYDGTTLHGIERTSGTGRPVPLSYYGRPGPAGQAFAELPTSETRTAALIGLGAGALACYTPPDGRFTFFEVDPVVARLALNQFTYLRDCPGRHPIVIGDGRLSLERAGRYGVVVVDAFNSDAIPVHLITRQAVQLYLRHGGAVLYHVSNRYLALEPVLGDIARSLHLVCLGERHVPTSAQSAAGYSVSQWAVLAPARASLGGLATDRRWHTCTTSSASVWTDDYSNVFSAIRWG